MWRMKQRSTGAFSSREIRSRKLPSLSCTSAPVSTCTTFNLVALASSSCQHDTMKENVSLLIAATPARCLWNDVCEQEGAFPCLSARYTDQTPLEERVARGALFSLCFGSIWDCFRREFFTNEQDHLFLPLRVCLDEVTAFLPDEAPAFFPEAGGPSSTPTFLFSASVLR